MKKLKPILLSLVISAFFLFHIQSFAKNLNDRKIVIYQVLPRIFGNLNQTNKPWGTIKENGVGKFADFTDKALTAIKNMGVTHIWYTGVLHHALIGDYKKYGISDDDPDVVKGRAGSPYAIKDYYNVDPDLAVNPQNRLAEFKALIKRTHKHGLKVIIDIVPNHVARGYASLSAPKGIGSFGDNDDKSQQYKRDNNFYYLVGEKFKTPLALKNNPPLNGEANPLADNKFAENPAKWTGNNVRKAQPDINDWYETVKLNFAVKPDGSKDFPSFNSGDDFKTTAEYFKYWSNKSIPDTWKRFKDITRFWLKMGVDGFRYDMAEMVPVEFWSYLNSQIKHENPQAILIAEIYNPVIYREYIRQGKMDYIYDKVGFYDTERAIIEGRASTDQLIELYDKFADIQDHMLHFLENHDEQRIASSAFAGDATKAFPAMVVATLINSAPIMIYFAQDLAEAAVADTGYGKKTRTTIFDYWGIASLQRWINKGKFDGEALTLKEKLTHDFYRRLLQFTQKSSAIIGKYQQVHSLNRKSTQGYTDKDFAFVRWSENEKLIIVVNFDAKKNAEFILKIPTEIVNNWKLKEGKYNLQEQLYTKENNQLIVKNNLAEIAIKLKPLQSYVYKIVPKSTK